MLKTKLIPAEESGSKHLMIVLHGLGDSMAGYTWVPQAMRCPWLNYLLVNAPDQYFEGFSWYEYQGNAEPGVCRSIGLLNTLLDAQRADGFPTEQTVLFGFSQGCLMTLETGLRYPHRFAGLVGLSGYVLDPAKLLNEAAPVAKSQNLLVAHGRQDPLIPCDKVHEQMKQLRAGVLSLEWHEYDMPHTIIEEEMAVVREFVKRVSGKGK